MTTVSKFTTLGAAGAEVARRAERYMAEKGCSYQEAMDSVLAADKQLAEAYAAPASRVVAKKPIVRPAAPVPPQMSQGNPAGYEVHLRTGGRKRVACPVERQA